MVMKQTSEILFFIPGRIRIRLQHLLMDERLACDLRHKGETVEGIALIRINKRLKTILFCYNPKQVNLETIFELVRDSACPLNVLSRPARQTQECTDTPTRYRNEKRISWRWFGISLLIGGVTFAINRLLSRLISLLIISCPGIVFVAPSSAFYYARRSAKRRGIILANKGSLEQLETAGAVLIHESVFLTTKYYPPNEYWSGKRYRSNLDDLVFGLRENGITELAILTEESKPSLVEEANRLGVGLCAYDAVTHTNGTPIIITAVPWKRRSQVLEVRVLGGQERAAPTADVALREENLRQIPWLFYFSYLCREMIIRCQNIAIAIHALGLLLAALGYLSPAGAIMLVGANIAWQPLVIRHQILPNQKETDNGIQLSACQ